MSSTPDAPSPDSGSPPPPPASPPPENSTSAPPPQSDTPPPDTSSPPPPSPPPPPASPPPENSTSAPPPQLDTPPPDTSSPPPPPPPPTSDSRSPPSPPPPNHRGDASPPPPPPPKHREDASPPPPPSSENSQPAPPDSSNNGGGLTSDQIKIVVGVAVGFGIFLIALIFICAYCSRKKKRKNRHYYGENPQGGSEQFSYNYSAQQSNWQNGPPKEHVVKLSQSPGAMGSPWLAQPPPPPMENSDDMSSINSGPYRPPLPPPPPNIALGFNKSTFTYDELAAATGGFDQANLLGQGGFGYVHKGVLPNGNEIAVKSLKAGTGQGEREFQAEVDIISRVHHRHLVSLVGYCIAGGQRMLVYEFVPNKTLEHHLHGKGLPVMEWPTRLRIALGSAKGLAYLHEDCHPRIIHRDIKAANILIDNNFEAMVADFGLAKLSSDNYTHVSTRVMGTFGYLAPEYAASGKLTEKSDVFSYGVMLLELITGKKPVDPSSAMEDSLVDWARPLTISTLETGNFIELVDPMLESKYNHQEMQRMIACAAASIRHSARKRPKMSQIVRALEGDVLLDVLNEGTRTGQSPMFSSSNGSSDYDTNSYHADMKRFRQVALGSQEFGSSEHGTSSNDSREMDPSAIHRNYR
ncbi:proline-rich receptor-like protein kinase PERK4 [Populus nigra]|uniref:proline-rich receptor-like protein kinase PERK4 n=1 Tax=Populus nigra TaxID=3691 RepID=UPI002B271876|nr:proline-rich receptor-like protein kinase PERK4 [Populus nigra]